MDENTKKSFLHDVALDFGIIIAACIIAGAIIFSALYAGKYYHENAYGRTISEREVSRQFTDQFKTTFATKPMLDGQPRSLLRIAITDLRYSKKADQVLVEFTLILDPDARINSSCILMDDGFGRYTGQWGRDQIRLNLLIK